MNKKILEKIKKLTENDSFLVTVTAFDKKKKSRELDTFVFSNNFPYAEFEGTKEKIVELIDEHALTQFEKM